MKIKNIKAYEILDSRGLPTVECHLTLDDQTTFISSCPSGLSTGVYEAHDKRDEDQSRYFGLGVKVAVENINNKIAPILVGKAPDFQSMDQEMINLDGEKDKSSLGANAILSTSISIIRAQAHIAKLPLYKFIADVFGLKDLKLPKPMFNILNGGLHASNGLCFQEFMVMPKTDNYSQALESGVKIYQHLKALLFDDNHVVSTGDEGGFAPMFQGKNGIPDLEAFAYIEKAIEKAGLKKDDINLCIDAAASHFFDTQEGSYFFHDHEVDSDELIEFYETLVEKYSIYSIEDGIDQVDYEGWRDLTKSLGDKLQVVGDDLFATNSELIKGGIEHKLANAVLIKPNQIGTVSETLEAIKLCHDNNLGTIASNRSGETLDTFIVDLAVGTGCLQFKGGGLARGERIVKYNRLLEIERELS